MYLLQIGDGHVSRYCSSVMILLDNIFIFLALRRTDDDIKIAVS